MTDRNRETVVVEEKENERGKNLHAKERRHSYWSRLDAAVSSYIDSTTVEKG